MAEDAICSLQCRWFWAPATVWHYFRHPIYGLVLNLLVVPLAAILVYSGILGILLADPPGPAGGWVVGAGHYRLAFYERPCGLLGLPGYSPLVGRPGGGRFWVKWGGDGGGGDCGEEEKRWEGQR